MRVGITFVVGAALTIGPMGCGDITPNLEEERVSATQDALLQGIQQAKLCRMIRIQMGLLGGQLRSMAIPRR